MSETSMARRTFAKCALLWPGFALTTLRDKSPSKFEELAKQIQNDNGYAWSWHCNLAVSMMDEGVDHETANKAAARFMQLAFTVDTSREPTSETPSDVR